MRTSFLALIPLLAACPSTPTETVPLPATPFDAVATFADYLTGHFDSRTQSEADPQFFAIQLTTCPVEAPELGDTVLYVEQAVMDTPSAPYRQRLYSVTGGRVDDEVRSVVHTLSDPAGAVGACDRPDRAFPPGSYALRPGCDVLARWEPAEQRFVGGTEGDGCASALGEAVYATSEVVVERDLLQSWDRGFSADGEQAWGTVAGPYRFVRRHEPEDASLDTLLDDVARATCDALFRCCGSSDVTAFFEPWGASDLLTGFRAALPPDADNCPRLVADMLHVTPLGDWIREAGAGRVTFDASAQSACLQNLREASCGEGVRAALFDSTCFGFAAPEGGEARAMFDRSAADGDECLPIRDGVGSSYYGSCDPSAAFCCFGDGCENPFDEAGNRRQGTCRPAAAQGQACSFLPPLQLCRSGLTCDFGTSTCVEGGDAVLGLGEACVDSSFNLLGVCAGGWCDLLGSGTCQQLGAVGDACGADWECSSEACDGVCIENAFCAGG